MSTHTSSSISSHKTPTAKTNGTINPTPVKKGDGSAYLGKKKDGAKGKEIKNEWLTSISNVQKQLTAISKELGEISKEIEVISKRLDDIKKNDASKSSTTNTTPSISDSDSVIVSSESEEIIGDNAAESAVVADYTESSSVVQHNGVDKKSDLSEALKHIQAASKASKLIANYFNKKVRAEVKKAATALNNFDTNESAEKDAKLIKKKAELNKRLQALLLGLEKIKLPTGETYPKIQSNS
jgi:hypothetical protein